VRQMCDALVNVRVANCGGKGFQTRSDAEHAVELDVMRRYAILAVISLRAGPLAPGVSKAAARGRKWQLSPAVRERPVGLVAGRAWAQDAETPR
jgi:hypothetical protein